MAKTKTPPDRWVGEWTEDKKLIQADSDNICCPYLTVIECGNTDEHKHLFCIQRTTCHGQKLMPNSTVKNLCLEDFKTCDHYILAQGER
jgi:hypothetical protein